MNATIEFSSQVTITGPLADIRCRQCGRLLLRWMRSGVTVLDLKCPRCGRKDLIRLST